MTIRSLNKLLLTLAAAFMLMAGCQSGDTAAPTAPVKTGETQAPVDQPVTVQPASYISPLTGEPLDAPMQNRPLAVMINNAPAARPQSGLLSADIVYEVLAEGGITRLVAIYQSAENAAKIGPVRSIRPYLIDLGESYHGVLVHAGGSTDAYAILQSLHKEDLDEISNAGAYFWRDKSRKAPHNLYSSGDKLKAGAKKRGYSLLDSNVPAYTFRKEDDPAAGEPASKVEIKFLLDSYHVSYIYNAKTKLYERFIGKKAHKDKDSGTPLTAENVVILGADHQILDKVGRLSVDLSSGGKAVLLQRGKVIQGQWVRGKNDVIRFVKDGAEVPFYPGKTYFSIVPNSPSFDSHVTITK
ncbi:putative lipoprotein YerB precursor [compost metagenome]